MLVSHRLDELAAHCSRRGDARRRASAELAAPTSLPSDIARELVAGTVTSARTSDEQSTATTSCSRWDGWTHRRNAFADVSVRVASGRSSP